MHFSELKQVVKKLYGPALKLRHVFPYTSRQRAGKMFLFSTMVLLGLVIITISIRYTPVVNELPGLSQIGAISMRLMGAFFLVFPITFMLHALEAFHRSYYFRGLAQLIEETGNPSHVATSWEVATIVDNTPSNDVLRGFLDSEYGQEIFYRAGIREEAYTAFFKERKNKISTTEFALEQDDGVTLATYTKSLCRKDKELAHFLATNNVSVDDTIAAAEWVLSTERKQRQLARWWSRDNLGRIPGLGKSWSYGETYLLERYGHDLINDPSWAASALTGRIEDDEVEEVENILARARQSNALIVGEDPMTVRDSVCQLYRKIRAGTILPTLESKRIFLIDLETVAINAGDKTHYEEEVVRMMKQAVSAGNIIVFFEDMVPSIASAHSLGVDVVDLLVPYFESDKIQIIISTDKQGYHGHLSRDNRISQKFDLVQTHAVNERALLTLLEQRASARERTSKIVFAIPALRTVARLADRYFPSGVMPDKAFDLLEELIPMALADHSLQILQSDVERLVYQKTGVPMGDPTPEEREKLLSLEDFLHRRVVGQEQAVSAVARALRRARAGVGTANKPMGSFLFLGPTGVGKTETAKALAEALFGNENMMNRLDMSEFQGETALEELIGGFETNTPGRLSTMIREQQYGVLLLDEFEKSSSNVHDLFLQVLDEGMFSDAHGKTVNARNLIIIATSNAGADLIWQWEKEGRDLIKEKRTLIDYLIGQSLYRPEFLNRFDDIIMFHPLNQDHVRAIAKIHLTNLAKRLADERNIQLDVTEELIARVSEKGYDPQFGGRPLTRAIKEEVEQAVADSILKDTLHPGDTYHYEKKEETV